MRRAVVSGDFSELNSRMFRFLEEAATRGPLEVLLWSDRLAEQRNGAPPRFACAERAYVLEALRYVAGVRVADGPAAVDALPAEIAGGTTWVADEAGDNEARRAFCAARGVGYDVVREADLAGFPVRDPGPPDPARRNVVVTGCYDWFHSGHVRFFEEVAAYGNLYVVVGHDANIRLLKGEGHPLFPEDQRRYMVQSIRFVHQALISTGQGWMDAEPEIERLKADAYAVNEDGDRPEKRAFCEARELDYIVLKREPKAGLARRSSTDLRGF